MTGLQIYMHGSGRSWHVHGDGSGPVKLAYDQVKGLFDPPVRTAWASGARQLGGKPRGRWYDPRDIQLGFHVIAPPDGDMEALMSEWWDSFGFREDDYDWDATLPRVQVISDKSDRSLDFQLYEHNEFDPAADPIRQQYAGPTIKGRAGMPFYYEPPVVATWTTGGTSGSGFIPVSNPTPLPMYQKWILTRGNWTIADRSIEGPPFHRFFGRSKRTGRDDSNRSILMAPIGPAQGGATIDLDPDALMVRDAHGTNLLGQMPVPGRYFEYEIPPHTQELLLPISVTGAPSGVGAMAQLVQPRLWPLPIGGQ